MQNLRLLLNFKMINTNDYPFPHTITVSKSCLLQKK